MPLAPLVYFGLYPATVADIVDPGGQGKVKVRFPALGGEQAFAWARLLSPYAEDGQGLQIMPSVDTEVIVGFEAGDPSRAYVIGATWNGREAPPQIPEASNDIRTLVTRLGSKLEFDDTDGSGKITLSMKSGHKVELDDSGQKITIASAGGCTLVLDASSITLTANASVTVNASSIDLNAPVVNCSGHVNAQTIATSSITSGVYSPGAGNIW